MMQNDERGIAAVMIVVVLVGMIGLVLWGANDGLLMSSANIKKGSEGQRVAASVMAKVKLYLSGDQTCSAHSTKFSRFRNFSTNAANATITGANGAAVPCLVELADGKQITDFKLQMTETVHDTDALTRNVKVSLTMKAKGAGVFAKATKLVRTFKIQAAELGYFNVVFKGSVSQLVTTTGASVNFTGFNLFALANQIAIEQIFPDYAEGRVSFQRPFYVRNNALKGKATSYDWEKVKAMLPRGIETGILTSTKLDAFLPDGSAAWNHGFDYSTMGTGGYALPEVVGGGTASVDCNAAFVYNAGFGAITTVPNANGAPTARSTCEGGLSPSPLFVSLQASENLTVNLTDTDRVFCGLVAAKTLTVNLEGAGEFGIFGNFLVDDIVVNGSEEATLHFHNPSENVPPEVDLPTSQSQATMAGEIQQLATSVARNFFLPVGSATPFMPRQPKAYMDPCPAGGGLYRFKNKYTPIHEQVGFDAVANGSAGLLYIVENAL